jgi:hypothetical protein
MASCPLQLILMGEIFTEHHGFLSTATYFNGRDIYRTPCSPIKTDVCRIKKNLNY